MTLPDAGANDGALTVEQIAALRQQDIDLEAYPLLRDAQAPIREQYGVAIDTLLAANARLQAELSAAVSRNEAYAIELDDATKALAWKAIGLADGDSVANGIERLFENLTVRATRLTADNDDLYERLSLAAEIMQAALDSDAAQEKALARLRAQVERATEGLRAVADLADIDADERSWMVRETLKDMAHLKEDGE